ncbi:helix-turn-helix domain-containing protein [Metasolibacillus meyeri]|uniref:helix-turn-helix domain-containing protein n=1 Tax=Metasolibacillus meyeri TaxID=1071052 RepID=UPI000D2FFC90
MCILKIYRVSLGRRLVEVTIQKPNPNFNQAVTFPPQTFYSYHLDKICGVLDCEIADLIEHVPNWK